MRIGKAQDLLENGNEMKKLEMNKNSGFFKETVKLYSLKSNYFKLVRK